MKKTVLMALLTMVMVGCKEEYKVQKTDDSRQVMGMGLTSDCLDFKEYDALQDLQDKTEWLKKNGQNVCENTLYEKVKEAHFIQPGKLQTLSNKTIQKTWDEVNKQTSGFSLYEKYISFKIDPVTSDVIDIILVDEFTNKVPCYSLALFRYIGKEHGEKVKLKFGKASINLKNVIVIEVLDDTNKVVSYYDYSDEPKSRGIKFPMRRSPF